MNEIIETLSTACLHSLWVGALVAGLLAMFLNVVSESRSGVRYGAAWLSLLAVIVVSALLSGLSGPVFDMRIEVSPSFQRGVALFWGIGFVASILRFAAGWASILKMKRESSAVSDSEISEVFSTVKNRGGIRQRVRLRSSELISGPVLIGWISPMVLIPAGWLNGVPASHLAAVFAHELAHARRWDFIVNIVQRVFESLMFFNPAVWWISSVIRREREHACDDSAVKLVNGATTYSRALVWFESHRLASDDDSLALAFGDGDRINGRINRLLRVSNDHREASPVAAISGITILMLTVFLVVVLVGGTRLFAKSSQEFAVANSAADFPKPGGVIGGPRINGPIDVPPLFGKEVVWESSDRPLFVSVPIVERDGVLFDIRYEEPSVFPDFPNRYLREHRLNFLDSSLPMRDLDGDGFSVVEEYQASTDPKDPGAHPAYVEKLKFKSRRAKTYKVKFTAQPDATRFQLIREPSAAWRKREAFILSPGDETADGQLKIEKFVEREKILNGIRTDSSILEVTFLPTGEKFELVRNVSKVIPIYFAEFESTIPRAEKFYVKRGDAFVVPGDPEKWTLRDVTEDSCTIFRKGEDGEEIVKTLTKAK